MPIVPPPGLNTEQRMTFIDIARIQTALPENVIQAIETGVQTGQVTADQLQQLGPAVFSLRLNPSKMDVSLRKVRKLVLTHAGYDVQYWRNEPWTFSYTGSSGVFRPDEQTFIVPEQADPNKAATLSGNEPFDIRLSKAWQKFEDFQRFYFETQERNLSILFRGETMIGYLDDFRFSEDANSPFHIEYSIAATIFSREFQQVELKSTDPSLSVGDRFRRAFKLTFKNEGNTQALQ